MSFAHYLRRAAVHLPHVSVAKAFGLLRRSLKAARDRKRDLTQSTYATTLPFASAQIERHLQPIPADLLERTAESRFSLAAHFLAHRFDLLGTGWVDAGYGGEPPGLEGVKFETRMEQLTDPQGSWLSNHVTEANLPRSKTLWQGVSRGYAPIDWQRDLRSGYRWEGRTRASEIAFGMVAGADIKLPWELGRLQHLPLLALSFASAKSGLSQSETPDRYLQEYRNQVLDFLSANPPRFGAQWACTMDVAIRVANLALAHDLFSAHGANFDDAFERAVTTAIYEHGSHIIENLEWNDALRGNHFLCNVAGLIFAGAYLPACRETDAWLTYGFHILPQEVMAQFNPDGTSFEGSTSYHRLSAETALYAAAMLRRMLRTSANRLRQTGFNNDMQPPGWTPLPDASGDLAFPDGFVERLSRLPVFTESLLRPDGLIPQFGDNDNGRFLKLEPSVSRDRSSGDPAEIFQDHGHLLSAFGAMAESGTAAAASCHDTLDGHVLLSLSGAPFLTPRPQREDSIPAAFPDFGLYVWKTESLYFAIRCGDIGQNSSGGHAHNDQLSFELSAFGVPVFVDTGTYVYSPLPHQRNRFRSTAMHNTLCVEGIEQASWQQGLAGLFSLVSTPDAKVVRAGRSGFAGEHFGFGSPHRRSIEIRNDGIDAVDECHAMEAKTIRFHLHPGVAVAEGLSTRHLELCVRNLRVALACDDANWQMEAGWVSSGYGTRTETNILYLHDVPAVCRWRIRCRTEM